ncbi:MULTISPECIES: response regulator transcription factor [Pandoraea]|uniref:Transcriptional regulator n=1 Tax=Pandoraea communis TaxID=2508297 RepID=A0A5E4Z085_9BURK|nr:MULTISPECIES: response regulator transcription factor [Pandoraea]EON15090.1 response regulator protein [Pandoraea sp. SD6-2]VVE53573.1 transcriptional regulator [Pandoraea communis]
MYRVLLVEDDARLAALVTEYLHAYRFEVMVVANGARALERFRAFSPDIVVLDLMLPGMDGMEICRQMRAVSTTPILILTAREDTYDQVAGLEVGADDYVVKPVEPRLLLARLRALLRRAVPSAEVEVASDDGLAFGLLRIVPRDRMVFWRGVPVELKSNEFSLLLILARSAGRVVTRDEILQQLRGIEFDGIDRTVDVGIYRLRKRFEDTDGEPQRIKTVWGRGYLFSPSAWES